MVEGGLLETSGVASLQVFACHEAGRCAALGHERPARLRGIEVRVRVDMRLRVLRLGGGWHACGCECGCGYDCGLIGGRGKGQEGVR